MIKERVRAEQEGRDSVAASMAAAGAIPVLVQLISGSQNSELLTPAAAVLVNVACDSPSRADAIVAAGGLAPLTRLMRSGIDRLQFNAGVALCNIAARATDSDAACDAILAAGAAPVASTLLDSSSAHVRRLVPCYSAS